MYDTSSKLHGKLSKKYIFMEIAAIEDTHLFIGVKGTDQHALRFLLVEDLLENLLQIKKKRFTRAITIIN